MNGIFFKEVPKGIEHFLKPYKNYFSKPQYQNFKTFVTGLIVNDKKTIQEVSDSLSKKNQSSLNRFVTTSPWDLKEVNEIRLVQTQKFFPSKEEGFIIVDDQMAHKTGKKMEKAGYHRSGVTKRIEWGHCIVDSIYTDLEHVTYPIDSQIYVNKKNCDSKTPYKKKREMALELIRFAKKNCIRAKTVLADSGYYAYYVVKELKRLQLKYILGVMTTLKISIDRKKRITVAEYIESLTKKDFSVVKINDKKFHIHTVIVSVRKVEKQKLIISYKEGEEDYKKVYVTNRFDDNNEELMKILVRRWDIECWHRDAKQHLGLEKYQVRKYRGIQVVVLAVLVAYTLLVLSQKLSIFSKIKKYFGRTLKTIGERCRFIQLCALKGWRWVLAKIRDDRDKFKELLNKHVLVKNAKV